MGDPSGIGPEVLLKALAHLEDVPADSTLAQITVYGDRHILGREAERLGIRLDRWELMETSSLPMTHPTGIVNAGSGEAAYRAIIAAARDAKEGRIDGIVTAPINKAAMNLAGRLYPGHTELLAECAGGVPVRMMLANDELTVVLDSIHVPLARAAATLDTQHLIETIRITDTHVKRHQARAPRIAVAGLNPHAGEGGLIGDEEARLIVPAIEQCRREGIDATGPHAPDTVFMRARGYQAADVVIALYHDQGLIPIKYLGLDAGVNITIGLPFVRTSPDHGTAFDLVGTGRADPASMLAAIAAAIRLTAPAGAGSKR